MVGCYAASHLIMKAICAERYAAAWVVPPSAIASSLRISNTAAKRVNCSRSCTHLFTLAVGKQ